MSNRIYIHMSTAVNYPFPLSINERAVLKTAKIINGSPERYLGDYAFWEKLDRIVAEDFKQDGAILHHGFTDETGRLFKIWNIRKGNETASYAKIWNRPSVNKETDLAFLIEPREDEDYLIFPDKGIVDIENGESLIAEWQEEREFLKNFTEKYHGKDARAVSVPLYFEPNFDLQQQLKQM